MPPTQCTSQTLPLWRRIGDPSAGRVVSSSAARILVLTGPSSVGKTSALNGLRLITRIPAVVLPADLFSLPEDACSRAVFRRADRATRLDVHRAMFRAYYRTLAEWRRNGFHALGETIFKDRHQVEVYIEAMEGSPHILVRLTCSPEERHAREEGRSDRPRGLSDETLAQELAGLPVDHALDTTTLSAREVASALLPLLECQGSPATLSSDR